jgi:hypothetical protein
MRPECLGTAAFFAGDDRTVEESRGSGIEGEGASRKRFGD